MGFQEKKINGFRELEVSEIALVSGGNDDGGPIIVNGSRPDPLINSVSPDEFLRLSDYTPESAFGGYGGAGGIGGYIGDSSSNNDSEQDDGDGGCPEGQSCVPVPGSNGMYVRGEDGKIYFSEAGLERLANGADTNWWGVAADLAIIVGGSLAGVGAGVLGVIGGLLGISGATLAELLALEE